MYLTYRYRIYPDQEQSKILDEKFEISRTAYNQLVVWNSKTTKASVQQNENTPFIPPVGCSCDHFIDQLMTDENRCDLLDRSIVLSTIRSFVKNRKQASINKTALKEKSIQHSKQTCSFNAKNQSVLVGKHQIYLALLGDIKGSITRKLIGQIISITFTKTATGRSYVCLLAKKPDSKKTLLKTLNKKSIKVVGIDMGICHYITLSDGSKYENPNFMDHQLKNLRRSHRQLSRKKQDSHNRDKEKLRLARKYEHIHNQRNGFLHMLSTELIKKYDVIIVESLAIKHMMNRASLSRRIADAAWRQFILMLQYKAQWNGKLVIHVPRYFPSSKQCCRCRTINRELSLKDREWICSNCQTHHDRDTNAAINILVAGTRQLLKDYPNLNPSIIKPVLSLQR